MLVDVQTYKNFFKFYWSFMVFMKTITIFALEMIFNREVLKAIQNFFSAKIKRMSDVLKRLKIFLKKR